MCGCGSAKAATAVGIGIGLAWVVLIGSGWLLGWMDDDQIALNVAMAVASTGGAFALGSAERRRRAERGGKCADGERGR